MVFGLDADLERSLQGFRNSFSLKELRDVCYNHFVIDLKMDEMYAAGALNTFVDELRDWIREKEIAIEKRKDKTYLMPILADLQRHVDDTKSLLVRAETYLASKQTN